MQETECVVTNSTSIGCIMPRLNSAVNFGDYISYEIRIDGVRGPDFSRPPFEIALERNPVFAEDGSALVTQEGSNNKVVEIQV